MKDIKGNNLTIGILGIIGISCFLTKTLKEILLYRTLNKRLDESKKLFKEIKEELGVYENSLVYDEAIFLNGGE